MALISFCISTYKRPSVLSETLKAIQRQTFSDFEVVVSDNDVHQSGKASVEAMADERFHYFPNEGDLGMKASFNKSLERSTGEFIVMMADDDPIYFDMAETLVNLHLEFPGYGMYMGGCDWVSSDPEISKLYQLKIGTNTCLSSKYKLGFVKSFDSEDFLNIFFSFSFFPHYLWSTTMVRREIITKQGGIPNYGTPFLGDYAYLSVMGSVSGCVIINKSLGYQSLHSENFGRNQNEQLITAVKNFPEYVLSKINHISNIKRIEHLVRRFTALWAFSHLSFLYKYYDKNQRRELKKIETEIFKVDYLKNVYIKYFLNTRFPSIHKQILLIKNSLVKKT